MLRSPQILAWTCPIRTHRPLLLGVRDSHLPAQTEPPCQRWNRPRAGRTISLYQGDGRMGRGGGEEALHSQEAVSLYLTISSQMYDCESSILNPTAQEPSPNAAPSNCPQLSQDSFKRTPRLLGLTSAPWKTTALEHLGYAKATDCSNEIKCLLKNSQTERCQHSSAVLNNDLPLSVKSKTNSSVQGVTFLKHHFLRMHGSTLKPWSLDLTGTLSRPPSLSLLQSRGLQQAVPHQATLKYCLSIENEARCRQSLGPNTALYEKDRGRRGAQEKWAAVLISLCFVQGEPAFLFTLRSSMLKGRHKGDVSFAGGKRDPSDKDVVDTALREAQEELGVTVAADRVWGVLKPLRDMSGMMIAPVLANLGPLEALSFKPNPGEVEEIFTLSLSHVCSPQNRGYTHFRVGERYGYTLPVFRNGKHRVWGLTAVALDHTLKLIVPP